MKKVILIATLVISSLSAFASQGSYITASEDTVSNDTTDGFGSISVCGITVKTLAYTNGGANVELIKKDFASSGGQVKTCIIKDGMRTGGQTYTAVVSIYANYALALLVPSFRD